MPFPHLQISELENSMQMQTQQSNNLMSNKNMIMAGVPLLVAVLLYLIKPSWLCKYESESVRRRYKEKKEICLQSLALYTIVISLVILAALYFFNKNKGMGM